MQKKAVLLVALIVVALTVGACGAGGQGPQVPTQEAAPAAETPTLAAAAPTQEPAPTTPPATDTPQPTASPTSSVVEQWAIGAIASSEYDSTGSSALQATGEPNTAGCADEDTAWASASASGLDWLQLSFARPVIPSEIHIYETYSPGSIIQVDVIDESGRSYTVWNGQAQAISECPRVFRVPVTGMTSLVSRVRIVVDQSVVGDWDEIDAVKLIGEFKPATAETAAPTVAPATGPAIAQWASQATASSEYDTDESSARQATGEPNTPECGDFETAWASEGASERAWLEASFTTPVRPVEVVIYESYRPGSIVRVEVIDTAGSPYTVWEGTPAAVETCPRAFRLPVTGVSGLVARVRITLDQSIIQDWNEIDAVQLVGVP